MFITGFFVKAKTWNPDVLQWTMGELLYCGTSTPLNGILFSNKNEVLIQQPGRLQRNMLCEKSIPKTYTLYDSTYITILKWQITEVENQLVVARGGVWREVGVAIQGQHDRSLW